MTNPSSTADRVGIYGFCWGKTPPTADTLTRYVQHAESCGIDSVHFPWHFTLSPKSFPWGNQAVLDPFVMLPLLLGRTSAIKIALDPWVPTVIHPFFWAQFLSTMSVASGGRVMSGARTAWWTDDITVGMSSPDWTETGYEQALDVVTKLWGGATLDGSESDIWKVEGLRLEPAPAEPISLWIDGGDDFAVSRAARFGTAVRPLFATPEKLAALRTKIDEAAAQTGRAVGLVTSTMCIVVDEEDDAEWVRVNVTEPTERRTHGRNITDAVIIGTRDECAERLQALFDAGADYLLLDTQFHGWQTESFSADQVSRLTEDVLPKVIVPISAGK